MFQLFSVLAPYGKLFTFVWNALVAYAATPEGGALAEQLIKDFGDDGFLNDSYKPTTPNAPRVVKGG